MNTSVYNIHIACSHMANRLNFMYDADMHIDTSLHIAMYTPYIGNTQYLPHEHECAYSQIHNTQILMRRHMYADICTHAMNSHR